ncbi:MAG TPA: DUF669 domain-containing protein [Phycisphaerales bacterium]|nr:DUF669 domain-containing protein [Phycisphaerales bacterium]
MSEIVDMDWEGLDNSWADANTTETDTGVEYKAVPDGPYVCVVDRVEFRTSKSGNPYLSWVLIVQDGPHEGRWLFKRSMLANAQNMSFLKKDIAACGATLPPKLSDFDLKSLLDVKIKITKKTKGEFENIYIDRVVEAAGSGTSVTKQEISEDDLPF